MMWPGQAFGLDTGHDWLPVRSRFGDDCFPLQCYPLSVSPCGGSDILGRGRSDEEDDGRIRVGQGPDHWSRTMRHRIQAVPAGSHYLGSISISALGIRMGVRHLARRGWFEVADVSEVSGSTRLPKVRG